MIVTARSYEPAPGDDYWLALAKKYKHRSLTERCEHQEYIHCGPCDTKLWAQAFRDLSQGDLVMHGNPT